MKPMSQIARVAITIAAISLCAATAAARPVVTGVVNAASNAPHLAPGALVSIFGQELASSVATSAELPLPRMLNGVSVTFNGIDAPLLFVSPRQINAQIPFEVHGDRATLAVSSPAGRSLGHELTLWPAAPGIFTTRSNGSGEPLLFDENFELVDRLTPGQHVVLYATGLGATDPPAITGDGGSATEPFHRAATVPEVYVGEQEAMVTYAGLAPGYCGVYQLNFVVPDELATDRIFLLSRGVQSNVAVLVTGNIRHVTGSGHRVSENRPVRDFHRIRLLALAEVEVTVGQSPSLRIETDDNVLEFVETRVKDGVLEITALGAYTVRRGVKIYATTPTLDGIEVLTFGTVRANNVRTDTLEVHVSGMGIVSVSGTVRHVDARLHGVGSVKLFDLTARTARAVVYGMGRVEVNASESLFARVNGFGSVVYDGAPDHVDARANGFGTIRPRHQWWNWEWPPVCCSLP